MNYKQNLLFNLELKGSCILLKVNMEHRGCYCITLTINMLNVFHEGVTMSIQVTFI